LTKNLNKVGYFRL